MTPLFEACFAIVVGIEGVLSLDPKDPGNYSGGQLIGTKYGVSAAANPGIDIPNLTLDGAQAIHLARYWTPAGCDLLPPRAALCAYDAAINEGVGTAIKLMQRALGVPPDGVLGPRTAAAYGQCKPAHIARFLALRGLRYASEANFDIDGASWFDRLFVVCLADLPAAA